MFQTSIGNKREDNNKIEINLHETNKLILPQLQSTRMHKIAAWTKEKRISTHDYKSVKMASYPPILLNEHITEHLHSLHYQMTGLKQMINLLMNWLIAEEFCSLDQLYGEFGLLDEQTSFLRGKPN